MFLDGASRGAALVIFYLVALGLITGFAILLLGRRSRIRIRSDVEIRRVERQARRLTSSCRRPLLFAPQATVVEVTYSLWQPTVLALLGHVEIVLLDISVPTESILWELRTIRANKSGRPVLLAQIDRLNGWMAESGEPDSMLFETLVAARVLPLMTYSAPRLHDVDTLALAMSDQAVPARVIDRSSNA